MRTFLVERKIPPAFRTDDPENVALHARWAVDTYKKVGAFWIGGVVTDNGMFSLVTAEQEADLHEYGRILGFPPGDMVLRRVVRPLGPFFARASS
jgi:hypothetical protein